AFLQAPVHVRQNSVFHPPTTHDVLPFLAQPLLPYLKQPSICSRRASALPFTLACRLLRGGLVPLAAFRTPGRAAISARSPSIAKSSKSLRNPAPDTCAAAPPLAVSPAICRSRGGSFSSAFARPSAARCLDASQRHQSFSLPRPRHPPSPAHSVKSPCAGNDCPAASSAPSLSRSGRAR